MPIRGILCVMEIATIMLLACAGFAVVATLVKVVVWFTEMKVDVNTNKKWINENKGLIAQLGFMVEMWFSHNEKYGRTDSPVSLTVDGTTLLKESGAEEYIEKNKESLLKQFEDITEPYDIQKKATEVMIVKMGNDKDIKDFVFRKGENMRDVVYVASIALRNVVLEHKGIDIEKYRD